MHKTREGKGSGFETTLDAIQESVSNARKYFDYGKAIMKTLKDIGPIDYSDEEARKHLTRALRYFTEAGKFAKQEGKAELFVKANSEAAQITRNLNKGRKHLSVVR